MGLTIHYQLGMTAGSGDAALKALESLRARALDLPFANVSDVRRFDRDEIQALMDKQGKDHPLAEWRWAVMQGRIILKHPNDPHAINLVDPDEMILFRTWPGEDCEEANFGLARVHEPVEWNGKSIDVPDWHWTGFCKTQYASLHGPEHLLRCHLAVIRLLDAVKDRGLLKDVADEGGYWERRDPVALVKEVGRWDTIVAAVGGAIKDAMRGADGPIFRNPQFERLEQAGMNDPVIREAVERVRAAMVRPYSN